MMLKIKDKTAIFSILFILLTLLLLGYVAFNGMHKLKSANNLISILNNRFGANIKVKKIHTKDDMLVLDSIEIDNKISIGQIMVRKDFYNSFKGAGSVPAVFIITNAHFNRFILNRGTLTFRLVSSDTAEISATGMVAFGEHPVFTTAQGHFMGIGTSSVTTHDFRMNGPGIALSFDTLTIGRQGQINGECILTSHAEMLNDLMGISVPIRGPITYHGSFSFMNNNIESNGMITSDTLFIRTICLNKLSVKLTSKGPHYNIPEFSVSAFSGEGKGNGSILDSVENKKCRISLDLKNADLNLIPRKPQEIAFEGRFNGRMELEGTGKTWPEVLRKIKVD